LKPCMSKVISYNPSDCWKYFIPQHIFILCSILQISINEKWANQCIIQHTTRPDIQLLTIACELPLRIVVRPESAVMSIDGTIQFKSCFIRENNIERKLGSFFFMHSQNSIQRSKSSSFYSCIRLIFYE